MELYAESSLLNVVYTQDLSFGELLELAFLQKLRGEIEFGSADALATQIAEDVRQAANYVPIDHDDVRYTADVSSGVQARKDSGPS